MDAQLYTQYRLLSQYAHSSLLAAASTAEVKKGQLRMGRLPLVALGILLLPWAGRIRRSRVWLRRLTVLAILLVGAAGLATLTACGGGSEGSGSSGGSTPQTYNIAVTATSGTLSHSTTVTLTVQ